MSQTLKSFIGGAVGALLIVAVYHLSVGYSIYRTNEGLFLLNHTDENPRGRLSDVMLTWPEYVAAINIMNERWVHTMEHNATILKEIGRGSWQCVPNGDSQ